jgi:hypothetical protein
MIDDIVYTPNEFILEIPTGTPGGDITSYSMDGTGYDFESQTIQGTETSFVFVV